MRTIQNPILFVVLSMLLTHSLSATSIHFIQNDLERAKQQAAIEGKLIMVDFWAHWCSPCTWMDEQTFTDKRLSDYLNENYISVRIDIDNIEGFAHKEEYGIRYLPTILILNEQGQLIKKYEESFAPSKLLEILKKHNKGRGNSQYYSNTTTQNYTPSNPVQQEAKPAPTYRPALSSDYAPTPATNSTNTVTSSPTTTQPTTIYTTPSNSSVVTEEYTISSPSPNANNTTAPSYNTYTPSTNSTSTSSPVTSYSNYTPTNSAVATTVSNTTGIDYSAVGTYEFSVKPAPMHGYSVQVGAYYEYGNVLREVAAFQDVYNDVVYVHISNLNGAPCYKVLLGHYTSRVGADQQKAFLRERGMDCFVKDLAVMQ